MTQERSFKVQRSDDEWKAYLASIQAEPGAFQITRHHGTERAYTGKYDQHFAKGTYRCICCGKALFDSATKFDAGCGWPSYYQSLPGAVETSTDRSFFMVRTEVHCSDCGAHLGHVFEDGPPPTGLRFCMNSASLSFEPAP
jgi:peptide-methionine (R)-S-oxide reductase